MPPPETCHAAGPVLMLPFQERPSAPLPSSALAFPMFPSQSRFIPEYPQRVALWGAPLPLLLGDGTLAVSLAVLLNPELPEGGDCVCTSLYPPTPPPLGSAGASARGSYFTVRVTSHGGHRRHTKGEHEGAGRTTARAAGLETQLRGGPRRQPPVSLALPGSWGRVRFLKRICCVFSL